MENWPCELIKNGKQRNENHSTIRLLHSKAWDPKIIKHFYEWPLSYKLPSSSLSYVSRFTGAVRESSVHNSPEESSNNVEVQLVRQGLPDRSKYARRYVAYAQNVA